MSERKWIDINLEKPSKDLSVVEIKGSFGTSKMANMTSQGGFLPLNPCVKSWDDITHWRPCYD